MNRIPTVRETVSIVTRMPSTHLSYPSLLQVRVSDGEVSPVIYTREPIRILGSQARLWTE